MGEQSGKQNRRKDGAAGRGTAKPDGAGPAPAAAPESGDRAAAAALAEAVASAKRQADRDVPAQGKPEGRTHPAPHPAAPAHRRAAPGRGRYALTAAAAAVALLGGWSGARLMADAREGSHTALETASALRRSADDLSRLTGEVKALAAAVEALKETVARDGSEAATREARLTERLARAERSAQDGPAAVRALGAQLDRVETAARVPAGKLEGFGERLERIERQLTAAAAKPAALPAGAAVPAAAVAAAADPAAQTGAVEHRVDGWVLHEVRNGVALIESRNRRLVEVARGEVVPGVGRVEAIERRGRRWVVVTAKGVIAQ